VKHVIRKAFTITSKTGIQARPAAQLVNLSGKFISNIFLEYKGKSVNLKSIMGVMSLAVGKGAEITIAADGADEDEAIEQIERFIKAEIGE
jgi:phosphocarrier protein